MKDEWLKEKWDNRPQPSNLNCVKDEWQLEVNMPQPSFNCVKVAGLGDNMPPPNENPGSWQIDTTINSPPLQRIPMDTNMSQRAAMNQTTTTTPKAMRIELIVEGASVMVTGLTLTENTTGGQALTTSTTGGLALTTSTTGGQALGPSRPGAQMSLTQISTRDQPTNPSPRPKKNELVMEIEKSTLSSQTLSSQAGQPENKESDLECFELEDQDLEDEMYTMVVDMEQKMKEQRLQRVEEIKKEESRQFLATVIAVEEKEARKAKQARLSALARKKQEEKDQEWLREALSLEESREDALRLEESREDAPNIEQNRDEDKGGAGTNYKTPSSPSPAPITPLAGAPSGATMPQGEEPCWDGAAVSVLKEQEETNPEPESRPARPGCTSLQPSTTPTERGAAELYKSSNMQDEYTITKQEVHELGTIHGQEEHIITQQQVQENGQAEYTITKQQVQELDTLHGQEEHNNTKSPSSPPSSRAKKSSRKNQDRMKQRRKEQRRHRMSSSRNLSPENAGTTAIDQDPGTPHKPTKPANGQEMPPSPPHMPRDSPRQPTRRVGTYYAHNIHQTSSTLQPGKKATTEIDLPQNRKSAEKE